MGFNMFLADDLVSACTQRFKRSKIDAPTYRRACSDTARKTTKLLSLLSPDPLSAPFSQLIPERQYPAQAALARRAAVAE